MNLDQSNEDGREDGYRRQIRFHAPTTRKKLLESILGQRMRTLVRVHETSHTAEGPHAISCWHLITIKSSVLKILQECNQLGFSCVNDELDYFIDLLLSNSRSLPLGSHNLREVRLRFSPVTPRGLSPYFIVEFYKGILDKLSCLI
jgi:hypothetical protein